MTGGTALAGAAAPAARGATIEHRVARVLTIGTLLGVALLAVGVAGLVVAGTSPIPVPDAPKPFEPLRIGADLTALRAEAFVWLGLIVLIATPAARVAASLIGFARTGDRAMVAVAAAILAVIAAGVVVGLLGS